MPKPSLTPVPPTPGRPVTLGDTSPAWIGARLDGIIQVALPGIDDRHVALVEREDGWWVSEGSGQSKLNGTHVAGSIRIRSGDLLEITAGYQYRFDSGEVVAVEAAPEPPPRKIKKRGKPGRGAATVPYAMIAIALLAVAVVVGALFAVRYAINHVGHSAEALTDHQVETLDSLMVLADDHIERGGSLLELGLAPKALDEFAAAVNTLTSSSLRNHPDVQPRVEALEAAISAIYKERHVAVPPDYTGKISPLTADQQRTATLSAPQFASAFAEVAAAFQAQYGRALEVTGRDHAEHLSLYGVGGALDLRAKTMTPEQTKFVIAQCRSRKIRVKDFSQDAILQAEILAANQAGQFDRAGTGLHLHIDRFGGRRDRWTVAAGFMRRATSPGI